MKNKNLTIALISVFFILLSIQIYVGKEFLTQLISYGLDSGKYWSISNAIIDGKIHELRQWWLWPIGFPAILTIFTWTAKVTSLNPLWFTHVCFLLIHVLSMIPFYHISNRIIKSPKKAIIATLTYALFPPLVYLQLFIMSEAIAIPSFIWALHFAMLVNKEDWIKPTLFSSIAFFFCTTSRMAMAPAATIIILAIIISIITNKKNQLKNTIKPLTLFTLLFCITILINISTERYVTNNKVTGLSPNSSIAYLIARCHPAGYAFNCPECTEKPNCTLAQETSNKSYKIINTTFTKFMEDSSCLISKGGAGVTSKINGKGNYYIFNSKPWDSDPVIKAAHTCTPEYTNNLSYLFTQIDNISTILPKKEALKTGSIFTLIQWLILIFGLITAIEEIKNNRMVIPIMIGPVIPFAMAPIFISNIRYLLPYVCLYLILCFIQTNPKNKNNTPIKLNALHQ